YQLYFDERLMDGDLTAEFDGAEVIVDKMCDPYLSGAAIDFADTIEKQGFTIDNPNAPASSACGDSFGCSQLTDPSDRSVHRTPRARPDEPLVVRSGPRVVRGMAAHRITDRSRPGGRPSPERAGGSRARRNTYDDRVPSSAGCLSPGAAASPEVARHCGHVMPTRVLIPSPEPGSP